MSETKQEVLAWRRRFDEDFKRAAVRLVVEEKYSFKAAATAVGVCEPTLRPNRVCRQYRLNVARGVAAGVAIGANPC